MKRKKKLIAALDRLLGEHANAMARWQNAATRAERECGAQDAARLKQEISKLYTGGANHGKPD